MPRFPAAAHPVNQSEFFQPYIVVRYMPGVTRQIRVSRRVDLNRLIAKAWSVMARLGWRFRICLVLSPQRALYLEPDGTSKWSNEAPSKGVRI